MSTKQVFQFPDWSKGMVTRASRMDITPDMLWYGENYDLTVPRRTRFLNPDALFGSDRAFDIDDEAGTLRVPSGGHNNMLHSDDSWLFHKQMISNVFVGHNGSAEVFRWSFPVMTGTLEGGTSPFFWQVMAYREAASPDARTYRHGLMVRDAAFDDVDGTLTATQVRLGDDWLFYNFRSAENAASVDSREDYLSLTEAPIEAHNRLLFRLNGADPYGVAWFVHDHMVIVDEEVEWIRSGGTFPARGFPGGFEPINLDSARNHPDAFQWYGTGGGHGYDPEEWEPPTDVDGVGGDGGLPPIPRSSFSYGSHRPRASHVPVFSFQYEDAGWVEGAGYPTWDDLMGVTAKSPAGNLLGLTYTGSGTDTLPIQITHRGGINGWDRRMSPQLGVNAADEVIGLVWRYFDLYDGANSWRAHMTIPLITREADGAGGVTGGTDRLDYYDIDLSDIRLLEAADTSNPIDEFPSPNNRTCAVQWQQGFVRYIARRDGLLMAPGNPFENGSTWQLDWWAYDMLATGEHAYTPAYSPTRTYSAGFPEDYSAHVLGLDFDVTSGTDLRSLDTSPTGLAAGVRFVDLATTVSRWDMAAVDIEDQPQTMLFLVTSDEPADPPNWESYLGEDSDDGNFELISSTFYSITHTTTFPKVNFNDPDNDPNWGLGGIIIRYSTSAIPATIGAGTPINEDYDPSSTHQGFIPHNGTMYQYQETSVLEGLIADTTYYFNAWLVAKDGTPSTQSFYQWKPAADLDIDTQPDDGYVSAPDVSIFHYLSMGVPGHDGVVIHRNSFPPESENDIDSVWIMFAGPLFAAGRIPVPADAGTNYVGHKQVSWADWKEATHWGIFSQERWYGDYPGDDDSGEFTDVVANPHIMLPIISTSGGEFWWGISYQDNFGNIATTGGQYTIELNDVPGACFNGSISVDDLTVFLEWDNPADEDLESIRIFRGTTGFPTYETGTEIEGSPFTGSYAAAGATSLSVIDSVPAYSTLYYYSIYAVDTAEQPSSPLQLSITSEASPAWGFTSEDIDLQHVYDWDASGNPTVSLSWTLPANDTEWADGGSGPSATRGISLHYKRSVEADFVLFLAQSEADSDDLLTSFDVNLSELLDTGGGIIYYNNVMQFKIVLENYDMWTTTGYDSPFYTIPPAPANLVAGIDGDNVNLGWVPPVSEWPYMVRIRRIIGGTPPGWNEGTHLIDISSDNSTFVDSTVPADGPYSYSVFNMTIYGDVDIFHSEPATAGVLFGSPVPTRVSAQTEEDAFLLYWSPPDSVFLEHVLIRYNTSDSEAYPIGPDDGLPLDGVDGEFTSEISYRFEDAIAGVGYYISLWAVYLIEGSRTYSERVTILVIPYGEVVAGLKRGTESGGLAAIKLRQGNAPTVVASTTLSTHWDLLHNQYAVHGEWHDLVGGGGSNIVAESDYDYTDNLATLTKQRDYDSTKKTNLFINVMLISNPDLDLVPGEVSWSTDGYVEYYVVYEYDFGDFSNPFLIFNTDVSVDNKTVVAFQAFKFTDGNNSHYMPEYAKAHFFRRMKSIAHTSDPTETWLFTIDLRMGPWAASSLGASLMSAPLMDSRSNIITPSIWGIYADEFFAPISRDALVTYADYGDDLAGESAETMLGTTLQAMIRNSENIYDTDLYMKAVEGDRAWYARDGEESRAYYSETGRYSIVGELNYVEFPKAGMLVGAKSLAGMMYLFFENATVVLDVRGGLDTSWGRIGEFPGIGLAARSLVCAFGDTVYWVGYNGVWSSKRGGTPARVSEVLNYDEFASDLELVSGLVFGGPWLAVDSLKFELVLYLPHDAGMSAWGSRFFLGHTQAGNMNPTYQPRVLVYSLLAKAWRAETLKTDINLSVSAADAGEFSIYKDMMLADTSDVGTLATLGLPFNDGHNLMIPVGSSPIGDVTTTEPFLPYFYSRQRYYDYLDSDAEDVALNPLKKRMLLETGYFDMGNFAARKKLKRLHVSFTGKSSGLESGDMVGQWHFEVFSFKVGDGFEPPWGEALDDSKVYDKQFDATSETDEDESIFQLRMPGKKFRYIAMRLEGGLFDSTTYFNHVWSVPYAEIGELAMSFVPKRQK
jgi:hypothetical protein